MSDPLEILQDIMVENEVPASDALQEAIAALQLERKAAKVLRDAVEIIARNVKAGAVHINWCGTFADEVAEAYDEATKVVSDEIQVP